MAKEQNPIYAQTVIEFITVAAEYCIFLEKANEADRKGFLERITRLLPLVYVKATLLPYVEEFGDENLPEFVTEDDYDSVRHAIWRVLKGDDNYLEVFSPEMQFSETPITASISEDLADIYQDLKNFVGTYADRNEVNMNNALCKIQENFAAYWGQKAVNVMRPLHDLLYGHLEDHEYADEELAEDECHDHDHHHHGCECHCHHHHAVE